jgi:tripartite-type tricarboxylate transporter receptor subunit TctC
MDVIIKLHSAVADALAEPTVQHALAELGLEPPSSNQQSSAALGALQKAEIEKWWPIIKAANIKGQ